MVDTLYFLHIVERIIIVESHDVVYIVWTPVIGAEQYRLQFLENDNNFYNTTTRTAFFNFSLSDSQFKGKTFSVRVSVLSVKAASESCVIQLLYILSICYLQIGTAFSANGAVDGYSDPVEVDTKGKNTP